MERYLIDTIIHDAIVDTPGAASLVERLVAAGLVEFVVTHLQEDQLARVPDPKRRARLCAIPRTKVPTSDFIIGVSRLGMARLGEGRVLEAIRGEDEPTRHKLTVDAEIAATAEREGLTLVTEDRQLARRGARELSLPVWNWPTLLARLHTLDERLARVAQPSNRTP
jgi:hypothetical protein